MPQCLRITYIFLPPSSTFLNLVHLQRPKISLHNLRLNRRWRLSWILGFIQAHVQRERSQMLITAALLRNGFLRLPLIIALRAAHQLLGERSAPQHVTHPTKQDESTHFGLVFVYDFMYVYIMCSPLTLLIPAAFVDVLEALLFKTSNPRNSVLILCKMNHLSGVNGQREYRCAICCYHAWPTHTYFSTDFRTFYCQMQHIHIRNILQPQVTITNRPVFTAADFLARISTQPQTKPKTSACAFE